MPIAMLSATMITTVVLLLCSFSEIGAAAAVENRAIAASREVGGRLLRGKQRRSAVRQQSSRVEMQVPATTAFPPKVGIATIIQPTPYPPLPPMLSATVDRQPIDTWVGSTLVYEFAEQPTTVPLPSQAQLDLAFGCPVLINWPTAVEITAPGHCLATGTTTTTVFSVGTDADAAAAAAAGAATAHAEDASKTAHELGGLTETTGNWTTAGTGASQILSWTESCPKIDGSSTSLVTYAMPNGDVFGYSQLMTTMYSNKIQLRDCSFFIRYQVEEKIYRQRGKKDEVACTKYGSCDGTIFIQYFIYDQYGKTVAVTPYLTLFQNTFDITDTMGNKIATATRSGGWSPVAHTCEERKWTVTFADDAPGAFAAPAEQWPIAEMITMMAGRDHRREPTGMVVPTACELGKSMTMMCLGLVLFILLIIVPACFWIFCQHPLRSCLQALEVRAFPRRMRRGVKWET